MDFRIVPSICLAAALLGVAPARADTVFSLTPPLAAPDSRGFQNSIQGGSLAVGPGGVLPNWNFLDTWQFTLATGAQLSSLASTINFTEPGGAVTSGIVNLQLRLVGPTSTLVGWTNALPSAPGLQYLISYVDSDGVWDPGAYSIQVRGLLTGPAASYAGTLVALPAPIPLPASMPLLLLSLLGMTAVNRMRRQPRE